jgi:phenylalanyl-tRNA synthetase alpha chain
MADLDTKAREILRRGLTAIEQAVSSSTLYESKVQYLGKQGELSLLMREMGQLSADAKPAFGKLMNELKAQFETGERLRRERLDMTLPGLRAARGGTHPLRQVSEEIIDILGRLGFSVRTGPMIERDFYNFEALNMPKDHPARDMQDTFYIDAEHLLRTHTSPIQIRTMEREKPPLRILAPGSVFRCDADVTHSPNFHQIEGLLVDRRVSMAHLKGTIAFFVREFFGQEIKTRFRPSFFPFTEPSAEVDCQCPLCRGSGCRVCQQTGWIEIGGSGLVHPRVLAAVKIDPAEWQGFAFGFGVERMAMIRYGIDDIRLFSQNDVRFLGQFSGEGVIR